MANIMIQRGSKTEYVFYLPKRARSRAASFNWLPSNADRLSRLKGDHPTSDEESV